MRTTEGKKKRKEEAMFNIPACSQSNVQTKRDQKWQ